MMQRTQFPYKFDADSFREALFSVPENIRRPEYQAQLEILANHIPGEPVNIIPPEIQKMAADGDNSTENVENGSSNTTAATPQIPVEGQLPYITPEYVQPPKYTNPDDREETNPNEDFLSAKTD
jgi:hypothetical protein